MEDKKYNNTFIVEKELPESSKLLGNIHRVTEDFSSSMYQPTRYFTQANMKFRYTSDEINVEDMDFKFLGDQFTEINEIEIKMKPGKVLCNNGKYKFLMIENKKLKKDVQNLEKKYEELSKDNKIMQLEKELENLRKKE